MNSQVTTQVEFETQFAACIDKESTRYALNQAQVIPDGQGRVYVCGTDSKQLCVNQADGFTDKPVRIPGALLPSKKPGRRNHVVSLNGQWQTNENKFLPVTPEEGRFPPVDQVINPDAGKCIALSIDVDKLLQMAKALGGTNLTLLMEIPKSRQIEGAIRVMGEKGFGVCMPLAADDDDVNGIKRTRETWHRRASAFNAAWAEAFAPKPAEVPAAAESFGEGNDSESPAVAA